MVYRRISGSFLGAKNGLLSHNAKRHLAAPPAGAFWWERKGSGVTVRIAADIRR
jgi:hypothetical protein